MSVLEEVAPLVRVEEEQFQHRSNQPLFAAQGYAQELEELVQELELELVGKAKVTKEVQAR